MAAWFWKKKDDDGERPKVDEAIELLMKATIELGGTLSGEHGIGVSKAEYLPLEQTPELIDLQRGHDDDVEPGGLGRAFGGLAEPEASLHERLEIGGEAEGHHPRLRVDRRVRDALAERAEPGVEAGEIDLVAPFHRVEERHALGRRDDGQGSERLDDPA